MIWFDFFWGGVKIDLILLSWFSTHLNELEKRNICLKFVLGLIFFGGGMVPYPIFCCTNLLFRVKLGYTPNFTALDHLEVPWKFWVVVVVGGGLWKTPIITLHLVELSWVELRVDQKLINIIMITMPDLHYISLQLNISIWPVFFLILFRTK